VKLNYPGIKVHFDIASHSGSGHSIQETARAVTPATCFASASLPASLSFTPTFETPAGGPAKLTSEWMNPSLYELALSSSHR
jgi:hypothetical protein